MAVEGGGPRTTVVCGLCAERWPERVPPALIEADILGKQNALLIVFEVERLGSRDAATHQLQAKAEVDRWSEVTPEDREMLSRRKGRAHQAAPRENLARDGSFTGERVVVCRRCGWRHTIGAKSLRRAIEGQPERLYSSRRGLRRSA